MTHNGDSHWDLITVKRDRDATIDVIVMGAADWDRDDFSLTMEMVAESKTLALLLEDKDDNTIVVRNIRPAIFAQMIHDSFGSVIYQYGSSGLSWNYNLEPLEGEPELSVSTLVEIVYAANHLHLLQFLPACAAKLVNRLHLIGYDIPDIELVQRRGHLKDPSGMNRQLLDTAPWTLSYVPDVPVPAYVPGRKATLLHLTQNYLVVYLLPAIPSWDSLHTFRRSHAAFWNVTTTYMLARIRSQLPELQKTPDDSMMRIGARYSDELDDPNTPLVSRERAVNEFLLLRGITGLITLQDAITTALKRWKTITRFETERANRYWATRSE
jgi:hypothetical protein